MNTTQSIANNGVQSMTATVKLSYVSLKFDIARYILCLSDKDEGVEWPQQKRLDLDCSWEAWECIVCIRRPVETWMAVLVVTGIGNKDTPRMESHFVRKFTIEMRIRREQKSWSKTKILESPRIAKVPFYNWSVRILSMQVSFEDRNLDVCEHNRPKKKLSIWKVKHINISDRYYILYLALFIYSMTSRKKSGLKFGYTRARKNEIALSAWRNSVVREEAPWDHPFVIWAELCIASGEHAAGSSSFLTPSRRRGV